MDKISLTEYKKRILSANANPLYFGTELVRFPRTRQITSANTREEIDRGYKSSRFFGLRPKLKRLRPSFFKYHLLSESDKKRYVFTQSVDDDKDPLALEFVLWFLHLELDAHPKAEWDRWNEKRIVQPEDLEECLENFRAEREEVVSVMTLLGLDPIYYRSPGNVYHIGHKDGPTQHVQGLHVLIPLSEPVPIRRLQDYAKMLQQRHGLTCEMSVLTPRLNWRLPGQVFMDVVDPISLTPLHPTGGKLDALKGFLTELHHRVNKGCTPVSVFEGELAKWGQHALTDVKAESTGLCHIQQTATTDKPHKAMPSGFPSSASGDCTPYTGDRTRLIQSLKEPNTFVASVQKLKFFSRASNKYCAGMWSYEQAYTYCIQRIKESRFTEQSAKLFPELFAEMGSTYSETARHPEAFCKRILDWHIEHHDPSKNRDYQDRERIKETLALDLPRVLRTLGKRISFRQKQILSAFFALQKNFYGRVSTKVIYSGTDAICEKSEWFDLLRTLKHILVVVVQHNEKKHDCRQWGYSKSFIQSVSDHEQMEQNSRTIVEEKKEKEYSVSRCDTTDLYGPERMDYLFQSITDRIQSLHREYAVLN